MDYEQLQRLVMLLKDAGLAAGEEYPGFQQPEVDSPTAAVGLRELDLSGGQVRYNIRILSPRILGGWCCQLWAAKAVEVLHNAGMTCVTGEMEYLSGSDCFCIHVTAAQPMAAAGKLEVLCGDVEMEGVESFSAVRNQGRRLRGGHGSGEPVGVTPGFGGWSLELIQRVSVLPPEAAEPFLLTVREGERESCYTGCCWNEERLEHREGGLRLTRRGFALTREEIHG